MNPIPPILMPKVVTNPEKNAAVIIKGAHIMDALIELEKVVREWRSGGRTAFLERRLIESHDNLLKLGKW